MLNDILSILRKAGEIYRSAGEEKGVEEKGSAVNLVTAYDRRIQDYLVAAFRRLIPSAHFLDEEGEGDDRLTDGYCFVIDPIDGTTNFVKGYQHSAISVGLALDGEVILGAVLDPDLDNLYYAQKGKGAYLNGRRIHVSDCDMAHSLALFGTSPYNHELAHRTFTLAEEVFLRSTEIRRGGSAALDICYVAAGKADIYFELILRPWDWAGATLILQEAGGHAATCEGAPLRLDALTSYCCGNAENLKEFYEIYNAE